MEETEALQMHLGATWEEVIWERKFNSSTTHCPPMGTLILTEGLVAVNFILFIKGSKKRKVMWKRICARHYS